MTATSVADTSKSNTYTITVPAQLTVITTGAQLTGAVGTAYSVQLTTSAGVPPYKWTLDASSAALPTNWTLSSSGLLSGPAPMSGFTGGTYIFDVTDSGTSTSGTSTPMTTQATLTVTVTQAPAITFTGAMPLTGTYNTTYTGSTAATGGAGALTYSVVSGSLPTGLTLNTSTGAIGTTPTAPGTYNFTIQAADAFGDSNTQAYQVVISKATPSLSFAAIVAQTYGAVPFQVTASDATGTPSTGAITYSLTIGQTSAGTVTSGGMVTINGIGTVYLTASQAATANYNSTTATTSFTVAAEAPILTFTTIPTQTFGVAPFQVTATDASGTPSAGAITYTLTAGHTSTGTVTSGGMVTVSGIGTIYLTATQAANGNYAVGTATTSFQVAAEVPTLTFTTIPTQTYGVAPFQVTASDTGGTVSPGAITYALTSGQTSAGTVTGAGMVTVTGAGTVYLTASQATSGNYGSTTATTSFTVNPETPILSFASILTKTYGDVAFQATASDSGSTPSSGAITYALTSGQTSAGTVNSAGLVSITGAGTIYLTANQAANGNFAAGTASTTVTVNPETPILSFAFVPTKTYGNANFQVTASDSGSTPSGGAITYSLTSGQTSAGTVSSTGLVSITGAGTIYLTATQAANGNYAVGTATTTVTVNAEAPTLLFNTIPVHYVGDAAFQVTATDTAGLISPGAVTYALTAGQTSAGTVTSGGMVTITGSGTIYLTATQAASGNYAQTTATTTVTVSPALSITNGTTLPPGVVGNNYGVTLTASGGSGNYTWSLISGSTALGNLGLTFTAGTPGVGATASVAGTTPIAGGPASFTVQVSDTASHSVQVTFSVTVSANVTITTATLSPTYAYIGSGYTTTINALGGTGPYTWSISSGGGILTTAGLTLSSGTGLSNTISGTVASGTSNPLNFTVKVVDHNSVQTTQPYSLTVYGALSTTTPSSTVPGPAIEGQSYTGNGISASGGSGSYTWAVSGLTSGLTYNTTGNPLVISGTAPATSQTIPATVTLTDTNTGKNYGPIQYSIVVGPATPLTLPAANPSSLPIGYIGNYYSGAINASGGSLSGYVWSINGTQVPTDGTAFALTDGLSAYNTGGNTLSINGNLGSTAQTITLQNVSVTDSANDTETPVTYTISVVNPLSGYTVSGSVIYSGSLKGWVYLELVNSNCGGCNSNIGTAINATTAGSLASPGMAYTIHGVPPGTYTLQARMDNTSTDGTSGEVMGGYGGENAFNPAGVSGANVVVTNSPVTGAVVTLLAPTPTPTLGTATPTWAPNNGFGVFSGGAVVSYNPITNSNGIEIPNSYIVQWSLNNSFSPVAGSQCFPATAAQQPWIISGISGSGPYYFRAAGVIGSCASGTVGNYSAATSSAYTIADPSSSSGNLVQGTVTFSPAAAGPLYVGFYDQNTGKVYVTVKGSTTNPPTSGVSYSLYVPSGSNYYNFGIVDQKNDGLFVPGNIANVNEQISQTTTIASGTNTVNLALPSGNSMATVKIQNNKNTDSSGNNSTMYNIDLRVMGLYKQPASVRLQSAPSYVLDMPADIATSEFSGNYDEWDYYPNTLNANPSTSDVFTFNVTYTDGTSNSTANSTPNPITASPTAILSAFPTLTYPLWNSTGVSPTPTFTWTYPASASNYTYKFQLQDSNRNTIWSIPSQNGHSNGFSYSQDTAGSITWGVDPTGGGNTPSVNSLSGSSTYYWSIQVTDGNGNEAMWQTAFETAQLPLSLPSSGTATALQNAPFSQTLNATGGTGSGYVFSVAVGAGSYSTVPVIPASPLSLGGGLYVVSNGSALTFDGTLASLGTVTLKVTVTDSGSDNAGPNTYYINVVSPPTGTNNANLSGTYTCKIDGYFDTTGSRWAALVNFQANTGSITNGVWNQNSRDLTAAMSGTMTGSYSIGADNNGILNMSSTVTSGGSGTHPSEFAIALNNTGTSGTVASEFRMVEIDDVGTSPTNQHGSGDCYLTAPSTFVNNTFGNNGLGNGFAFGVKGENSSGTPKAYVGRFTTSTGTSGGTITSGILDGMRVDQSGDNGGTLSSTYSTYTAPDGNGRVTLLISPSTATNFTSGETFAVYIINASKMFMLETAGDSGVLAGDMRAQQQSSYSAANLSGAGVLYMQAYDGWSGSSVQGYDSSVFQVSGDGAGNIAVNESYDNNNGSYQAGKEAGDSVSVTFDSSNPGRATFSPGSSDSDFLYLFNTNDAFYLDLSNNYVETGWLEAQSGTFTNAGVAASYMLGQTAAASSDLSVGEIALTSTGSATANVSTAGQGDFSWDQSQGGLTYSWLSTTYGTLSLISGGKSQSCAVVSAAKIVCMDNTNTSAKLMIFQQ